MSRFYHSSGYVYLVTSPDQPDLCKIGHTRRPPHLRIKELGQTTWLNPMVIRYARFTWDCLAMEKALHKDLESYRLPGSEEWFQIPAGQAISLVRDYPEIMDKKATRKVPLQEDRFDLVDQFDWALQDLESRVLAKQAPAWQVIERLSASGFAAASWFLAESLEKQNRDASPWVYDAAAKQGYPGAALRRDWILSVTGKDVRRQHWYRSASQFLERFPDIEDWGGENIETWEKEIELCQNPQFYPTPQWGEELDRIVKKMAP